MATGTSARRFLRILAVLLALSLSAFAGAARAGCGTILTLNPTDHWVWITIYDVGEQQHLDWGWVGPHSGRAWHAGGAPTPQSYLCGSFYHVRYEVKAGKSQKSPPDVANIFDTRMQINPQLTLSDIVGLLHSIGSVLKCAATPATAVGCAAEWGIDEAGQAAIFGAIGSDSSGSVVCIKSSDDTRFYLDSSSCRLAPPTGKVPAPPQIKYTFQPASHKVGIGVNQRNWYFNIAQDGRAIQDNSMYAKGKFSTDNPGIAKFDDAHNGHIRGVKKGKTTAHWDYDGKRQASATIEVN
jgi:hypothetical protein